MRGYVKRCERNNKKKTKRKQVNDRFQTDFFFSEEKLEKKVQNAIISVFGRSDSNK